VWLGCSLAVLGAATAVVSSLQVPITYQATTRVQPSWRLAGTTVTLDKVDKYAASLALRLKSISSLTGLIEELKLPYTPEKLASNLSVTADRKYGEQIDVTVTDSDPLRASQIANAVVARYQSENQLPTSPDFIFVDAAAAPPQSPVRPRPDLEALVGAIAGALMALSLFYARSGLDAAYTLAPVRHGRLVPELIPDSAHIQRRLMIGLIAVGVAALLAGTFISGIASDPSLAFIAFVPVLLAAVLVSPTWRLAALVVGGLVVFQSSQTLSVACLLYTSPSPRD